MTGFFMFCERAPNKNSSPWAKMWLMNQKMGKGINLQKKSCGPGFLEVQEAILELTMGEERMLMASPNFGTNNCENLQDSPQA